MIASAAPAHAQYLVNQPEGPPPAVDPLPFGPSTADVPTPPRPPAGVTGDGSTCLPDNLPNASTEPTKCDPVRWFSRVDYLHWWMRKDNLDSTFITTDPTPNIVNNFGALHQSGTAIISGGSYSNSGPMDGVRWTFGVNPDCFVPVEFSGFYVHTSGSSFVGSNATGSPVLTRPIFSLDPTVLMESVYLGSFPGLFVGTVGIVQNTQLYGGEVNAYVCHLCGGPDQDGFILDATAGVRYAALREDLSVLSNTRALAAPQVVTFLGGQFGPGFTTAVQDHVQTRNYFYGGQVGLRACFPCKYINLEFKGDVGVGINQQTLSVMGATTLYAPQAAAPFLTPAPITAGGGIQAVASNSGHFTRDRVSTISDLGFGIDVPICDWLNFTIGYDLLVWTQVARPGDQLNRFVDTRQVPSDRAFSAAAAKAATSPAPAFNSTNFYAQGLTISLGIQY
jgi:hypothetical protein